MFAMFPLLVKSELEEPCQGLGIRSQVDVRGSWSTVAAQANSQPARLLLTRETWSK